MPKEIFEPSGLSFRSIHPYLLIEKTLLENHRQAITRKGCTNFV
jgi:hypothetical protein